MGMLRFAGLDLSVPRIMGILNVTPDSFFDGGLYKNASDAIGRGLAMIEEGADILDVGGESTRPGATSIDPVEEQARIIPVIEALAAQGALVSVDTRHPSSMRKALAAGAKIINDVSGLRDLESVSVASAANCAIVLMHMQGEPENMQAAPCYRDVVEDVMGFFSDKLDHCAKAGIEKSRLCIDPGIGFGKTLAHNVALLRRIGDFTRFDLPVLLGTSRKSFIGGLSRGEKPADRLGGSIASVLAAADQGIRLFRVHDVKETRQALRVWQALKAR